jgi:aldose 1-epimerase
MLKNPNHSLKDGLPQTRWSYVCLETQKMPDSINHENFTNVILDAGEVYDTTTVYKFINK